MHMNGNQDSYDILEFWLPSGEKVKTWFQSPRAMAYM